MKGVSLPINLVVIIAIAVLVLLALAAFFAGGFGPPTSTISHSSAWNQGCGIAKNRGCLKTDFEIGALPAITGYDPNGDGNPDGIIVACAYNFGVGYLDENGNLVNLGNEDLTTYCWKKCCS